MGTPPRKRHKHLFFVFCARMLVKGFREPVSVPVCRAWAGPRWNVDGTWTERGQNVNTMLLVRPLGILGMEETRSAEADAKRLEHHMGVWLH